MGNYQYPALTADALIRYKKNNVILIRRKNPPFKGKLALPGGFMDTGELPEQTCIREVKEETNLDVKIIKKIGTFSDKDRDPRGHVITIAFLCEPLNKTQDAKAQDDAASLEIVPLDELHSKEFAFDHKKIIEKSGILRNVN
ncbi:MAG: NUDIX hydrolase [Promethearchaeota archaeon]|nr:MAG: NUDIX hydrolase [Candidatus Lokiarchaeota archaeon]